MQFFRNYIIFFSFFLFGGIVARAQEFSLGLKGGGNYSVNKLSAQIDGSAGNFSTDSRIGYQGGAFAQLEFGNFFVRPEIFYSHARGEFPFPENPSLYSIDKLSIPVLVGHDIYRPLRAFAGPAYQTFLKTRIENVNPQPVNQQNNWAFQLGILWELKKFQFDLRYDITFDSRENQRINIPGVMNNAYFDDGRLNQFMLSINFKIFDSANLWRRKRSCYF
ncbi:outer membrane beta-barrel protein [Salinimicrobium sediminilitoris]|uniref:outer membrane beta-barrel protein n=1 Tax=Salinimicrobium sediminilitoris TaxID=2876715 RepID=UPI001E6146C4|nr:outer membrane beta-barrel protein [Salinimicrobium sediminilitoris]MCC8358438.1 outer membrane beta-barrel protein [Salinimicrobium sediminilitoris]